MKRRRMQIRKKERERERAAVLGLQKRIGGGRIGCLDKVSVCSLDNFGTIRN